MGLAPAVVSMKTSKQTSFVIEDKGEKVIAQGEIPTTPEGLSQLQTTYHFGRRPRSLSRPVALPSSSPASSVDSGSIRSWSTRMRYGSRRTGRSRKATHVMLSSCARDCDEESTARSCTFQVRRSRVCATRGRGDEVEVTVVSVDSEKRRIALSMIESARRAREAAELAESGEIADLFADRRRRRASGRWQSCLRRRRSRNSETERFMRIRDRRLTYDARIRKAKPKSPLMVRSASCW
jgi:hypothetical protein